MDTLYLTRGPVITTETTLIGYDLRVRSAPTGAASMPADGQVTSATAEVLQNALLGLGVEDATGSCVGFLNIDRALLFSERIEALPFDGVVLGLPRDVKPEREVLFRLRALRDRGFSFSLSDYGGQAVPLEPLLDQVAVVQVDLAETETEVLESLRATLRRPGVRLMARGVQTAAQFQRARDYGFDLFEGYHFLTEASHRSPRINQPAALLRMLKLLRDDADALAIVDELKRQPKLSVAVLRSANASSNRLMRSSIASLQDALSMLGRDRLARLVQMVVFAGESDVQIAHNPALQVAVARAKLLEDLAQFDPNATTTEQRCAFVVGLLSLIEPVIGVRLDTILDELQYEPALREALLQRAGKLGVFLELAEKMEQGDDLAVADLLCELPALGGVRLLRIQLETLAWLRQSGVS